MSHYALNVIADKLDSIAMVSADEGLAAIVEAIRYQAKVIEATPRITIESRGDDCDVFVNGEPVGTYSDGDFHPTPAYQDDLGELTSRFVYEITSQFDGYLVHDGFIMANFTKKPLGYCLQGTDGMPLALGREGYYQTIPSLATVFELKEFAEQHAEKCYATVVPRSKLG